jgi:GT2 family glycosyltransferase
MTESADPAAGPIVTVVVPHYSDLAGLSRCLEALERQSIGSEQYRIIVADNGSPEGMDAVSRVVDGRADLVLVEERGAGPARNAGARQAVTPFIAFTDSDCVPDKQWLEEALKCLRTGSAKPDFVGGRVEVLVGAPGALTPAEAFERVFAFDNELYVRRKQFTVTANLVCPRAVFEQVGGFRNGVSEDLDWCHRAKQAGFRIGYAGQAIVGHPARHTLSELTRKWTRIQRETASLIIQRPADRLRWLGRGWLIPMSIVPGAIRVCRSDKLTNPGDRWRALVGLAYIRLWRFFDAHSIFLSHRPDRW